MADQVSGAVDQIIEGFKYIHGESLVPMVYLYHIHMRRKYSRGDTVKTALEAALRRWMKSMMTGDTDETRETAADTVYRLFTADAPAMAMMLDTTVNSNVDFSKKVSSEIQILKDRYSRFLAKTKGDYGYYSSSVNGNTAKTTCDYYPIIDLRNSDCFDAAMEMGRILIAHDLVDPEKILNVRTVDIRTGKFAVISDNDPSDYGSVRYLGIPEKGMFTLGKSSRDLTYHTFNGTSVQAIAMMKDAVTRLSGISSVSWSTHRGVTAGNPLGFVNRKSSGRGTRTIAGSMVFVLTDQHPLIDLFDAVIPKVNPGISSSENQWYPRMLPDELPPFDLTLLMMNEYGIASVMSLYGIEFVDSGGVMSVDSILSEDVLQYTARNMDPIMQIKPDANGVYDFSGLFNSAESDLWVRREQAAAGVLHSKLVSDYDKYCKSVFYDGKEIDAKSLL